MPSIGSGDVAGVHGPGIGDGQQTLQPLDLGNGLLNVHLRSVYVEPVDGGIPFVG